MIGWFIFAFLPLMGLGVACGVSKLIHPEQSLSQALAPYFYLTYFASLVTITLAIFGVMIMTLLRNRKKK